MNKRQLLKQLPRHFNVITFSWEHFEHFCQLDGICVIEGDLAGDRGRFLYHRGRPVIFLDAQLSGVQRSLVAFHELAHFWLHDPGYFHRGGLKARAEAEADLVAVCALIPKTMIETQDVAEIIEECGCSRDLIQARLQIYRRHQI